MLPSNLITDRIEKDLNSIDIQTVINSSKIIMNIVICKNKNHIKSEAGIYSIACLVCD